MTRQSGSKVGIRQVVRTTVEVTHSLTAFGDRSDVHERQSRLGFSELEAVRVDRGMLSFANVCDVMNAESTNHGISPMDGYC